MDLEAPLFLGIDTDTLLTSAVTVVLLAAGHLVLRGLLRRAAHAAERDAAHLADAGAAVETHRHLAGGVLRRMVMPLVVLLWNYGLYFALAGPLREAELGTQGPKILAALGWLRSTVTLFMVVWLLSRLGKFIEAALIEHATHTKRSWDDLIMPVAGRAVRLILPLLAVIAAAPMLSISPELARLIQHGIGVAVIAVIVFLILRLIDAGSELILNRYGTSSHGERVGDSLQQRAVRTQVMVLRKLAMAVIVILGLACMLMVFDAVRRFGTTLLASAGVAGIIVGFAAQRSLGALLAGIQIALTQPIRVDDVVVVEGEWGRIEDITLTYVVVAIWDERRLILPINYFIEKPFQNWTRTSTQILGTVMLYTDYSVPLAELRAELQRQLKATELWDHRVGSLQVTDSKERTLELRVLVSAADAGRAWDLRCLVREQLVVWLQRNYPASLPKVRTESSLLTTRTLGSAPEKGIASRA